MGLISGFRMTVTLMTTHFGQSGHEVERSEFCIWVQSQHLVGFCLAADANARVVVGADSSSEISQSCLIRIRSQILHCVELLPLISTFFQDILYTASVLPRVECPTFP